MREHCWHFESAKAVGKKSGSYVDVCCWCGFKRTTLKTTRPTTERHGPRVKWGLTENEIVEQDEAPACVEREAEAPLFNAGARPQ